MNLARNLAARAKQLATYAGAGAEARSSLGSPLDPPLSTGPSRGPIHLEALTYQEPGTYQAFVSVSNGEGGYAAQTVPIQVSGPPSTPPVR